jgi:hypothetical protein
MQSLGKTVDRVFLLSYRISVAKRRGKITTVIKTGKLPPLLRGLNKKSVARNRGSLQRSLELIDENSLRNEVQQLGFVIRFRN